MSAPAPDEMADDEAVSHEGSADVNEAHALLLDVDQMLLEAAVLLVRLDELLTPERHPHVPGDGSPGTAPISPLLRPVMEMARPARRPRPRA